MKQLTLAALMALSLQAEASDLIFSYDVSEKHPYGYFNPDAPKEVQQFSALIGEWQCISHRRLDKDNWAEPEAMLWRFKYIMNGMAVQDETLKQDGVHSGSIRQFDEVSKQWQVHYYSMGATTGQLPLWQGGKSGDDLVFMRQQAAPNGMEGFYRLTFSEMTGESYHWQGDWVSTDRSVVYPTWRISCKK